MGHHTVRGLRSAIGLLTRLPVSHVEEADLPKAVAWVPVVGGFIGLVIALVYSLALEALPALPAAGLALTFGVLVTGAFHEDGLADTADGFGGGSDREDVIRIMRDPMLGTFGVIALVTSFAIKLGAMTVLGVGEALVLLPAVHALSRGASIGLMAVIPPASAVGVGMAHAATGNGRRAIVGILAAIAISLLLVGWWTVAFVALAGLGTVTMGWIAQDRIGGFTGDVLGAVEQVGEVLLLSLGAALASRGLLAGAWWN
ncbi:MAG TPA: adenosylcobinamide-GDP ribazoletransferase [Acidimicrobiia bacterium]|nr:adenosylcobinamide-GDP ribazoletransferase [Acidimicrobiia bacterium]